MTVLHAIYALIVAAGLGLTSIVSLAAPSTLRDDDNNNVIHVTEAAFIFDATDQPPPDTAPWESQALPDNWNEAPDLPYQEGSGASSVQSNQEGGEAYATAT